ncbi:hypothetical protein PRIPAC_85904 [Pristionchus pacificus]|uniref:Protein kinase domain-containing protein n=1 Tax=Pristionchus pacificus TaxID=54126 RepID=A0A2A6BTK6_PRIPA|nr:hypothetical protein PRIPAC_85904 [Pristionchus pacificus]|eukprot:PDM69218.1 protein kinase [Pristionchus pacificus]
MASGLTFNVPDEDERASDRSLPAGMVSSIRKPPSRPIIERTRKERAEPFEQIGRGRFNHSIVVRGKKDNVDVAMKLALRWKVGKKDAAEMNELYKELVNLGRPNFVKIFGYAIHESADHEYNVVATEALKMATVRDSRNDDGSTYLQSTKLEIARSQEEIEKWFYDLQIPRKSQITDIDVTSSGAKNNNTGKMSMPTVISTLENPKMPNFREPIFLSCARLLLICSILRQTASYQYVRLDNSNVFSMIDEQRRALANIEKFPTTAIPKLLNNFKIHEQIGRGNFHISVVHRASYNNTEVAVRLGTLFKDSYSSVNELNYLFNEKTHIRHENVVRMFAYAINELDLNGHKYASHVSVLELMQISIEEIWQVAAKKVFDQEKLKDFLLSCIIHNVGQALTYLDEEHSDIAGPSYEGREAKRAKWDDGHYIVCEWLPDEKANELNTQLILDVLEKVKPYLADIRKSN